MTWRSQTSAMMRAMFARTELDDGALREHLRAFSIGELLSSRDVSSDGLGQSYELATTGGRFLLRALEGERASELRFEREALAHLAARDIPVPRMVETHSLNHAGALEGRVELTVFELPVGRSLAIFEVNPDHAAHVGAVLARLHVAGRGLRRRRVLRPTTTDLGRMLERASSRVQAAQHVRDVRVLALELVRHVVPRRLPSGLLVGGLGVNKARFERGALVAVADLSGCATGPFVVDLAMALTEWAFWKDALVPERARALVAGYQSIRRLTPAERGSLFDSCCLAATRAATLVLVLHEVEGPSLPPGAYQDYRHHMLRLAALRSLGASAFRDAVLGRRILDA